ncbi:MAG: aminotransferase class V-fold PLP-dependent enzyme [Lachnospiraceae bacterium]|nr:aminotransferase class V-fold PLP-dependent enzyme [Lachnospiraceae bacterium]
MTKLYDALIEYGKSDYVPFHMPGHKRALMEFENPYSFDITEIDGFDNLHHAEGIIKEAEKHAALVCQSDETHFLVNGSSCGILSAIFSATKQGGELIMARNCHKTVYHAAELRELKTHYLYPEMLPEGILGSITVEMVEASIEKHPEASALILTSPTYDGVVSDVREIVKAAHAKGVTVIIDEAHGAHFLKESGFPKSAIRCGADVVIQSTHKTLPALTQTALIHINKDYKYKAKVRKYLTMFQTTSPSYVLMASIDSAMHWYVEEGREAYKKYLARLGKLRAAFKTGLKNLQLLEPENVFDYDISKVLISTKNSNISGEELHKQLVQKYHIQSEMVSAHYVLFMTSVADTDEYYRRFLDALLEIDEALQKSPMKFAEDDEMGRPKALMRICEAVEKPKKSLPLLESMGETSASYVYIYPPGIPLLTPGEKISERCVRQLQFYLEEGLEVYGLTKEREIEIVWVEFFT